MSLITFSSPLLNSGAAEVLLSVLQLTHVLILGCWLGAELVINRSYRYAIATVDIPFAERDRVLTIAIKINQGVRYALVLIFTTGLCLVSLLGYLPFNFIWALAFGFVWLFLIYLSHKGSLQKAASLAKILDRDLKLIIISCLIAVGGLTVMGNEHLPIWLAVKLLLFAGIIACGLGLRLVLSKLFVVWNKMRQHGSIAEDNMDSRRIYFQATIILIVLWALVAGITIMSLLKPV